MKPLALFTMLIISVGAMAQQDRGNDKKYKLSLPDKWKGNRYMLDHLTTIAPAVFTKLEKKQFCLDCKTPYTLMFFYDSVSVDSRTPVTLAATNEFRNNVSYSTSNYECITTFHFKGTWVLMYKDSAIAELELVSPAEDLTVRRKFSIARDVYVASPFNRPGTYQPNPDDNPFQFINRKPENFDPTVHDILAVIEERIKKVE